MSAVLVISCDEEWNGMPCRGALPTHHTNLVFARMEAATRGWSRTPSRSLSDPRRDRCPAHTHALNGSERSCDSR